MAIGTTGETLSGNAAIDPLLDEKKWNSATLTVGFPVASSAWAGYGTESEPFSGFTPLTSDQQQAVSAALGSWSGVAALNFVSVTEPGQTADIRFAGTSDATTAYTYLPSGAPQGGDVWFGPRITGVGTWVPGSYQYDTAVHEIGHAIGLKHPQDTIPGGIVADPAADSIEESVMSYRSYPGAPLSGYTIAGGSYPGGPMLDDIAAAQYLYGANYATNAGDTVYRFTPDQGTIFRTIWDGGGNDSYDLSAYATGVSVDLAPGAWSTFSTAQLAHLDVRDPSKVARGNVANAFLHGDDPRSLIENAVGGAGNDTIVGNQAPNTLIGGSGADLLTLPADGTPDTLVYREPTDGGAPGLASGFDQVTGFEPGIDRLALAGDLRSVVDRNQDGALAGGVRGTGSINGTTDEAVFLSTPVPSLTDADFASLRAAVGSFVGPPPGHDLLALATDGTGTAAYLLAGAGSTGGSAPLAPSDVRLLCLFPNVPNIGPNIGLSDLALT